MSRIKYLLLSLLLLSSRALSQNYVLELDGQESYVQLPGHIFDDLEAATVEAWVKWEDWDNYPQWFASGANDQWRAMGINRGEPSSSLQFFIYTGSFSDLHLVPLKSDLALGQWCHMAAVSGPGGMRFYLNGMQVGQNGFEGSFAAMGSSPNNYLGTSNWRDNAYFRGQLDEVRVWSVARSGEQIRAALAQPLRGDEAGLVGLWNFDAVVALQRPVAAGPRRPAHGGRPLRGGPLSRHGPAGATRSNRRHGARRNRRAPGVGGFDLEKRGRRIGIPEDVNGWTL
jgi:hypothetical protein